MDNNNNKKLDELLERLEKLTFRVEDEVKKSDMNRMKFNDYAVELQKDNEWKVIVISINNLFGKIEDKINEFVADEIGVDQYAISQCDLKTRKVRFHFRDSVNLPKKCEKLDNIANMIKEVIGFDTYYTLHKELTRYQIIHSHFLKDELKENKEKLIKYFADITSKYEKLSKLLPRDIIEKLIELSEKIFKTKDIKDIFDRSFFIKKKN